MSNALAGISGNLLRRAGAAFGGGRYAEALEAYESVRRSEPGNESAMFGAASCRHALGDLPRAAGLFARLADAHPGKVMYRYNQGYCLLLDAQYDAAVSILRKCNQRVDDPHVKANLAIALQYASQRDLKAARKLFEQAAAARPKDATVQGNLAFLHLLTGDYETGWRLHERRASLASTVASTPAPLWLGESLAGKTLLLWPEQGLGDSLQFVRYLPLVARRAAAEGGTILFQPPQPLYRLFADSFVDLVPVVRVFARDETIAQFDFHCSLLSLPERLHTTLATVPAQPYLRAEPAAVARWKEAMGARPGMKVGLVWGGAPWKGLDPIAQQAYDRRNVALEKLAPLLEIEGVTYYSLQKGEAANQAPSLSARGNFVDLTGDIHDFADTAALAANLDLVITIDTSVCHLAGGLGCETWLLNRRDGCWRWLLERDDSPWYPTLRLYRQTRQGVWSDVIARIAHDLRAWAGERFIGEGSRSVDGLST